MTGDSSLRDLQEEMQWAIPYLEEKLRHLRSTNDPMALAFTNALAEFKDKAKASHPSDAPTGGGLKWCELKDAPEGKEVLLYTWEYGHAFYYIGFREQDTWMLSWTPRTLKPTAWMPLPEPPAGPQKE